MHRHPIFEMPAYGLGKYATLDLSSNSNHIVHAISVGNMCDILIEDGPGIKFGRYVMGHGANNFHASLDRPADRGSLQ